ncbi:YidC/Oxa1 family membrane protein insertase [Olsenella sp. YH-ols2217]|uniref:Membrane protein insertase YidC n=1 Tax=Kribbibacterium absianum TaxID=3044210 RepID=A0ABT6ZJH7_9ACTN|nr:MULTISPECIES: YidC/Oxa1 family membrane protein insertase [unclassified Olsenella]MDJ1122800.1 YidC/Oxa1 family membrane protein insertase [Olsenella sp. YH-ols2216]MDJ1129217.1 YidC/Oxa1 family membrane protein insertase [Olsenella sp. YH-ols2217]
MWEWFIGLLSTILGWIADFCGDWGLAIMILTIIIRLCLTPLQNKSLKSSAQMQVLQPKMQEIQQLYADDPMRQQQELQKIYSEHKFNPFGGCLPVIIQMPVFFALFSVLRDHLPADACFYGIFPSLADSVSNVLATSGFAGAWVYILFDILFGVFTLIPMLLNMRNQAQGQTPQTLIMGVIMAGMMMWFGWSVPVGVLLYYNASSLWGIVQQVFITNRMMEKYKKEEEAKVANGPIQVNVVRKEQKPRPKKKS